MLFLGRVWPTWNTWSAIFASWLMKENAIGVDESWKIFNVDCRVSMTNANALIVISEPSFSFFLKNLVSSAYN